MKPPNPQQAVITSAGTSLNWHQSLRLIIFKHFEFRCHEEEEEEQRYLQKIWLYDTVNGSDSGRFNRKIPSGEHDTNFKIKLNLSCAFLDNFY